MSELAQRILQAITQDKPDGGYIRVDTTMFLIDQQFADAKAFDNALQELIFAGELAWVPQQGYRFIGAQQSKETVQ